jgi:hypothetical protein
MTEHEIAQKAFHANRERLKAERRAREAAGTPVAAKKTKKKFRQKSFPQRTGSVRRKLASDQ